MILPSITAITLCSLGLSVNVFAKTINLYEQPKTDAKVVSSVDLSAGIIPIYTPKEGKWVKVADPRNGNVGWVQSSDLSSGASSTFSFTQSISNGDKAPITYKFIQFGEPAQLTKEQKQDMMKEVQTQQKAIQQSIQTMMQEMDQQFNSHFHMMHEPFIMPVVVVPVPNTSAKPIQPKKVKSLQPQQSKEVKPTNN